MKELSLNKEIPDITDDGTSLSKYYADFIKTDKIHKITDIFKELKYSKTNTEKTSYEMVKMVEESDKSISEHIDIHHGNVLDSKFRLEDDISKYKKKIINGGGNPKDIYNKAIKYLNLSSKDFSDESEYIVKMDYIKNKINIS